MLDKKTLNCLRFSMVEGFGKYTKKISLLK